MTELNDTALITVKEARLYCFRNEDDTSRDPLLIDSVNDVSDSIWEYLEREPKPTTGTTTSTNDPGAAGVSLTVSSFAGFPTANGFKVKVDTEIMLVTAGAGTLTWTVTRAQDGTTGAAHTIGSAVTEIEARTFRYNGAGFLDLGPYDLNEVESVELYTDLDTALQVTLTAAQYRLEPRGRAPGGTYLGLVLPYPAIAEPDYGFGWQATVTGTWGMPVTPGPIKLACKQWVDNLVKNPGSFASHQMSGYQVIPEQDQFAGRAGMPPAVRHRLDRFKRTTRAGLAVVRFGRPNAPPPGVPHQLPVL
jgi:hypothetical protein